MAQFGAPNFLSVIDAYEAGSRQAERNRLADLDAQGRQLAGQALSGNKNALSELYGLDPERGMKVQQFTDQQKQQFVKDFANAAYDADTPEKYAAVIQRFKGMGHTFDPSEEDFGARQSMLSQAIDIGDRMGMDLRRDEAARAQRNADRAYALDERQLGVAQANANRPQYDVTDVGGKRVVMDMRTGNIVRELGASPNTMQPRTSITDIGGKRVLVDENTGNVVKELGDSPTKQQSVPTGYQPVVGGKPGEVERLPGYKDTDYEIKLRTEFQGQTKDFRDVRDAYNRIQASAQNPTPAGDLALIFNYMKMLDPGSVVRESEFSTAAQAAPFLTRVGIDPNKVAAVWSGERLTPEQRTDFLNRAQSLYAQQENTFNQLADQYRGVAEKGGLDPASIILTPTARLTGSGDGSQGQSDPLGLR